METKPKSIDSESFELFHIDQRVESGAIVCTIFVASTSEPKRLGLILADVIRHHQVANGWTEEQVKTASEFVSMEIAHPTDTVRTV